MPDILQGSKTTLSCVACKQQLCRQGPEIDSEQTQLSFLNNWLEEENGSERRVFTVLVEDIKLGALATFETAGGLR